METTSILTKASRQASCTETLHIVLARRRNLDIVNTLTNILFRSLTINKAKSHATAKSAHQEALANDPLDQLQRQVMQAKDNLVWIAEAKRHGVTTRNELRIGLNKCRGNHLNE
jgi:hypothetical protein